ncbi:hypothetical protein MKX03_007575 [Papaver bracteatum]|nr:hypothetical protein MKX03_007575 [Papaver bracteatum]
MLASDKYNPINSYRQSTTKFYHSQYSNYYPKRTRSNHNHARNYVDTRRMAVHHLPEPKVCDKCGAKMFSSETKEMCCKNKKVSLPQLQTPAELRVLCNDQSEVGKHFRQKYTYIQSYVCFHINGSSL